MGNSGLLLGLTPGISSAVDHKYSIPVPGTDAEVKFTSVYNLEQRGNTFYTLEGDAAIVFKFGVNRGDNFFLDWSTRKNVLSRASENSPPTRYVRESPHRYDYVRGYIPVGTYTNTYGDPVMAYMEAGMVYGSKAYNGKNITFTMEVTDLDGIGRTLESAWIYTPPTAAEINASKHGWTWFIDAENLRVQGKYEEALYAYNMSIDRFTKEPEYGDRNSGLWQMWYGMGMADFELGEYNDSVFAFSKSIEAVEAYHNGSYFKERDHSIKENASCAWNGKVLALRALGKTEEADAAKAIYETVLAEAKKEGLVVMTC